MEAKTLPLVSICIPTYNGGTRIHKPLLSIWEQHYPNLEIIISDNFSLDNTQEVIEAVCKDHPEIKYIRQARNIGMMGNFNFLLKNATGKYIMWLSDDDRMEPGVLSKYVSFLELNQNYSLASGKIQYWKNYIPDIVEEGFTFEQNSSSRRVINFYFKVIYCGLMHGLIRREFTKELALRHVIGNDYHFVANLVFLGKIKNFDFVGYNKNFGGLSSNFKRYAKAMGESRLAGVFPHIKMAIDAYGEIMRRSSVFSTLPVFSRFGLAIASFTGILYCYYIRILVISRIKKYIFNPLYALLKKPKSNAVLE